MGDRSTIEWTDATWNPVTGCTKVSEGCRNCYIENTFPFRSAGRKFVNGTTGLVFHPDRLTQPLHWKKPRKIFLSLSDLFHEEIPDEFVYRVFRTMAACQQHTFQILTKRPERMRRFARRVSYIGPGFNGLKHGDCSYWPNDPDKYPIENRLLRNVWLGVSVEDQQTADERIPILLQTPTAIRFVSAEPLLGMIKMREEWLAPNFAADDPRYHEPGGRGIDWLIPGGESGHHARPVDIAWIRSLVEQAGDYGVACFVKQLGAVPMIDAMQWRFGEKTELLSATNHNRVPDGFVPLKYNDKKGGDPNKWPEDLRVREFPKLITHHPSRITGAPC